MQKLTPEELRNLASLQFKVLRAAANEIERQQKDLIHANQNGLIYEQVIDNLAAAEREKVQSEMGSLRARLAVLNGKVWRLTETLSVKEEENKCLKATIEELQSDLSKLRIAARTDQAEAGVPKVRHS